MLNNYRPRHAARRPVTPRRYAGAIVLAGFAVASTAISGPASAAPASVASASVVPTAVAPSAGPANPETLLANAGVELTAPATDSANAVLTLVEGPSVAGVSRASAVSTHAAAETHHAGASSHHAGAASLHVVRGQRLTHTHKHHRHHHPRYVGPYSPARLVSRMHRIMARNGTGENLDPFFGSEPDGSWYRDCQHFVANLDGHPSSGYSSASVAWSHFLATGAAHPAYTAKGKKPMPGAWLYFGDNHVVVYLGHHKVAGTDTWGEGTAKIGPERDVRRWLAFEGGYKGWVVPWGR